MVYTLKLCYRWETETRKYQTTAAEGWKTRLLGNKLNINFYGHWRGHGFVHIHVDFILN